MRQEFQVHRLNENGMAKAKAIAEAFSALLETIEIIVPAGRELSIVKTKLEEASYFAKRGMAVLPSNQLAEVPK